ncbi:MAG TPA: CRISPR-associated protein Cas4 [Methanocorpusculum sp.]|nr:CRISPR-associated protein Cas4 [Methanocorpusculum sp.]
MNPDEYLMVSGIQHFAFCKRQWALIHVEQLWAENSLTFSGNILHKNADDPFFVESRGDILTSRRIPLVSHKLKVYGIADVIEYHRAAFGVSIPNRDGYWNVVPVEYKSGKRKSDDCDEVQLCCQAICLEEMYDTSIPRGYLYYGKTRHRTEVIFDEELREHVVSLVEEMYVLFENGITPSAVMGKHCESCSIVDLCVPTLSSRKKSVDQYLDSVLQEYAHEKTA